ncbi:ketopantoate reductase family protein [Methanolobus bombayensis]|uniref:ketopantoate reductase family protein n=1 Tax=Methanolobus bombayensis TaxID=38023 RepID=UPI001AE13E3B|nr:ketopantoate reductase family protein [Methanolobus bombayensis]MBP1908830.1 2-dehydropantoate 2-reductase [Methanolobus bombayensis]
MKVLILGAGAVGLTLAAKLSSVCDVHAVCRRRHADKINSDGFKMTGIWGEANCKFSCSDDAPEDDYDYIFITSKSTSTESICEQFADIIKDREVISMQNGLGNEEIIAKYTDKVIGGTIITGFEWAGDAQIHVSVETGPMNLGRFPSGLDDSVIEIVELVKSAGIQVSGSENIMSSVWSKVLYNSALNPLGAVMGVPYGKLENSHAWSIIENIVQEAFMVTEAEGVVLPWKTAEEYLAFLHDFQLPNTAEHHSSMYQDITSGRKTEIDFLNGAIVSRAKKLGIDAPYNTFISEQIRFMEALQAEKLKQE